MHSENISIIMDSSFQRLTYGEGRVCFILLSFAILSSYRIKAGLRLLSSGDPCV